MIALTLVLIALFFWWEPHAENPMLPLHLFKNHTVQRMIPMVTLISAAMSLVGAFMPLFLQSVTGISPTNSGLLLVPMMAGLTIASTYVGRRTTITGHYRMWPITGSILLIFGLGFLAFIEDSTTGIVYSLIGMTLIGFCTGAAMPVTTTAIQNSVNVQDMGVATSLSVLCRSLGSTISLAAYGALLNSQVIGKVDPELLRKPREINSLPEPGRSIAIDLVSDAITLVYRAAIPLAVVALVLAYLVKEVPLRTHAAFEDSSVTGKKPTDAEK
jgi:MFS family permease